MAWAVPENRSSIECGSIIDQSVDSDSDSDSFDSDLVLPRSTKKSETAFGVVRNRLIRGISHNSNSDQPSRVSVGNSEEEVARRAELRRIMRLRIQDQLESDEAEDQLGNKSKNTIWRVASFVDVGLPISGPRDAIEFGVNKSSSDNRQPVRLDPAKGDRCPPQNLEDFPNDASATETVSLEEPSRAGGRGDLSGNAVIQRPSPIHLPAHVPLTEDTGFPPSQRSFQLSNSSGRLGRILGPDNSFKSRQASSGDGQSALGVWLIAQGLRSGGNSAVFFDEDDETEIEQVTETIECNSPITNKPSNTTACDDQAMSKNMDYFEQGSTPINSPEKLDLQFQPNPDALKDRCDNPVIPGELPWGPTVRALLNSFTDSTSSSDPSKPSPSPVRSRQNLYKLDIRDLKGMVLSPFRCKYFHLITVRRLIKRAGRSRDSPQIHGSVDDHDHKLPNTDITHSKSSRGIMGNVKSKTEMTHDTVSLAQSESTSFVQRETELRTIKRRFSEALTQKKPEKVVLTRFRENFSHSAPRSPVETPFRDNIHLEIPMSHSRAKSEGTLYRRDKDNRGIPHTRRFLVLPAETRKTRRKEASERSKRRSNLSIRPHMSRLPTEEYMKPSLDRQESAMDLWQRAVRLEAERRHSSSLLNTPNPDQRSLSSDRSPKAPSVARNSNSSISDVRREISQLTPSTDERSSPSNSKELIERWVAQMRPKSVRPSESVTSIRLVGPPRSWSKFPSFNREERNRNVTSRDRVQPRDFAVKHVGSEGQIRWATDIQSRGNEQHARTLPRSLSTKFGGLVKSKMSRVMPPKGLRKRVSQAFITRSIPPSPTHMEYPEMGIRPSELGYTELQALGREITNIKGQARLSTLEKGISRPQSSRSLGDRVVSLMHEAIGHIHSKHDEPSQSADVLLVPVTPSVARQSIAATTTDVFVTPKSHFSDDEENGEEKGEAGTNSEAELTKTGRKEVCPIVSENGSASVLTPAAYVNDSIRPSPENKIPTWRSVAREE